VIDHSNDVKSQGNGVYGGRMAPSLDVGDVEDEDSRRQDGGYPDESRIGG
jgi:hypothetical protein